MSCAPLADMFHSPDVFNTNFEVNISKMADKGGNLCSINIILKTSITNKLTKKQRFGEVKRKTISSVKRPNSQQTPVHLVFSYCQPTYVQLKTANN